MIYAIKVENGVVTNRAKFKDADSLMDGWEVCPEGVGIGHIKSGDSFSEPPKPEKTNAELQKELNSQSRAYLASTDWYIVRKMETGVDVPVDILTARATARASIVEV